MNNVSETDRFDNQKRWIAEVLNWSISDLAPSRIGKYSTIENILRSVNERTIKESRKNIETFLKTNFDSLAAPSPADRVWVLIRRKV